MTDTRFKIIDLVGKRFSRWVVESYAGSDGRNATWMCACDCGNKRVIRASHLKSGGSTNCGCWSRDRARELSTRHGEVTGGKRSREYIAWQSMRSRCLYPKNIRFNEYGGRGITICDRWSVFENFLADMGRKPTAKHSLDPGICLAQRTRSAQRRDDPTPHVLDADIPSIERDADWIIGLWRRENFLQMNRPDHRGGEEAKARWETEINNCKGLAEAITLKHRRRKAFRQCRMHFDGRLMKFSEGK